jgi:hypothetical protein
MRESVVIGILKQLLKLPLQGAIGHAAPLAQQRQRLIHDRHKVHRISPRSAVVPVCA